MIVTCFPYRLPMPASFKIVTPVALAYGPSFLEQWLTEVLDIAEMGSVENRTGKEGAHYAYARQHARLARLLLELAGIPVFDPPAVLSLTVAPGGAENLAIELALPDLGLIVKADYRRILAFTADLCKALVRTPVSDTARENLFIEIDRKIIEPAQGTLTFGKSTMHLLRGAHRLGIPFMHLGAGVYQIGWGSKARRLERSMSDRDSAVGKRLVRSKAVSAALLRMAGLPAPVHLLLNRAEELPNAADRLGFPLVVKPADSGRGEGVTVDIADAQALDSAFALARKHSLSAQVIVERQVPGVCHRIFIANGKLLYAVKRLPISIVGDGHHRIAELIDHARAKQHRLPPWQRSPMPELDEEAHTAIRRAGWTSDAIPGPGVPVPLRRIESTQSGGVDEDVSATLHPENLAIALRAANLMGLDIAGVDIISVDITRPWFDNGAIINEVNVGPLFGGGEISRSRIPDFFRDFIDGDGRIPIETFSGPAAQEMAKQRQRDYGARGLRCFIVSADCAFGSDGEPLAMPLERLDERVQALLCRSDTDALVVVKP